MLKEEKIKKYSLEELTDKYIGKSGTLQRGRFDVELSTDVIEQKAYATNPD